MSSTPREELVTAGAEVLGGVERDAGWEWINVRAPDGNLYELASRRRPGVDGPAPNATST